MKTSIIVLGVALAVGGAFLAADLVSGSARSEPVAVEVLPGAPLMLAAVTPSGVSAPEEPLVPPGPDDDPARTAADAVGSEVEVAAPATAVANPATGTMVETPEVAPPAPDPAAGGVVHPPSVEEAAEVSRTTDGTLKLTFRALDFDYELPDPVHPERHQKDQIPPEILAFHGEKVEIQGYMVPLTAKGGLVTTFYLARDVFGCCFGDMPKITEMIEVEVIGDGVPMASGIPVAVVGKFEVGEEKDDFGYVNSIYRIDAEIVREQW